MSEEPHDLLESRQIELTPEQNAAIDQAFPLLSTIHTANQGVVSAPLPADHPTHPGEDVAIDPYYMNRADPPDLGVWGITIGEQLKARITSLPGPDGRSYTIVIKGEDGKYHRPINAETAAQADQVIDVLSLAAQHIDLSEVAQPKSENMLGRMAAAAARRLFK